VSFFSRNVSSNITLQISFGKSQTIGTLLLITNSQVLG